MKTIITKNTWFAESDLRLDASFHISDTNRLKLIYKNSPFPFSTIDKQAHRIFSGNIFRRTYVSDPERGIPYITGSDMMKSAIDSGKYLSKKQAIGLKNLMLQKGWILVSCSGTLGNTVYTNELFSGRIGTHDLIRIIPNNKDVKEGFLYAYLSCKYGYTLLTQSSYGGVVKHIEPHHIANISVPIFPIEKQEIIHNLIVQAGEFRTIGNKRLSSLRKEIEQSIERELNLNLFDEKKYASVSLGNIQQFEKRFDAPYYSDLGRKIFERIITVDNVSISSVSEVFHPILFGKKQIKGTPLKGNALFKSSSMMQLKPETDFWLSLKKVESYSKLQVKTGWVLVSRTGTVGNIIRISERQNDIFIDDHMIRIIPKENYSGLIYIYLSTIYGKELIKFQKYGSVQDVINSDYIGRIPIPKFLTQYTLLKRVQEIVEDAHKMIDKANIYEQEAIQLIETEIAQWQQ